MKYHSSFGHQLTPHFLLTTWLSGLQGKTDMVKHQKGEKSNETQDYIKTNKSADFIGFQETPKKKCINICKSIFILMKRIESSFEQIYSFSLFFSLKKINKWIVMFFRLKKNCES